MKVLQKILFVIYLTIHVMWLLHAHPQCVEVDGIPAAGSSVSSYAMHVGNMLECVKKCFRYQMENYKRFYNGVLYHNRNCSCVANMTDITGINPDGRKACFFGRFVEDLSLTLIKRPDQHHVEVGKNFEHVFSISYTNLFDRTYQCLYRTALPNKEKRPFGLDGFSLINGNGLNLPNTGISWSNVYDKFGIQYQSSGAPREIRLLDKTRLTNNQFHYKTTFKMGDASESNDILFVAFVVNHKDDYGIYIRHAFIQQKQGNNYSRALLLKPLPSINFDHATQPIGYLNTVRNIKIVNDGNATATNYKLEFYFPPFVTLAHDEMQSLEEKCGSNFLTTDQDTNVLRIKLTQVDPAMRLCLVNIQWKANVEELRTIRGKIDYYIHGLLTYCPYQECNVSGKRAEMKEFKWGFTFFGRSKLNEHKKFRIKNVNSGRCWDVRENDLKVTTNSKCQSGFKYTKDALLIHENTGRYLYSKQTIYKQQYSYFADTTKRSQLYYLRDNHIVQYSHESSISCLMENESFIFHTVNGRRLSTHCPSWRGVMPTTVKILEGWDDYNLDVRSILKATTPLGDTVFICNPGGDKGNTYNCFFSNNNGKSWTAMDSLITNIRFYSTISESIYGTMNRGKSYFQLKLTYGELARIKPLSDVDYNSVFSQESNIHTQSFNNMALTVVKTETQFGSEVQVSSHGVYLTVNGVLKKVFAWGY
ncbi:uncharacterized protein LOC130633223 [Hydractinia symbiolongicarpus]|uniref:uncharacterized protein LOC130633223 n=1 Tax=Hydractinia symbiolongicarpus TaxID=13093 RepID=UPI00254AC1F8|nr:uncharacterized protein LOC130633223 [Hydractinia symbiolongicarpus]